MPGVPNSQRWSGLGCGWTHDRRQAMCDTEQSLRGEFIPDGALDRCVRFRVDRGGGLVEQDHSRVLDHRSCECDQLPFTAAA